MSSLYRTPMMLLALLAASSAQANWSFSLAAPGGTQICPAISEPFTYNIDTCQFVAQRSSTGTTRVALWQDAVTQAAVSFGSSACRAAYQHALWLDGNVYPLPPASFVQHQRSALSVFALTLNNCQRSGGGAPVSTGAQRLLVANTELATSGSAYWYFEETARRAYLRLTTVTGDVSCANGLPTPILGEVLFIDGLEAEFIP